MTTTSTATARSLETTPTGPTGWSSADEAFFRIVGELFRPAVLMGASVLLASYDPAPPAVEAPA
jgi:hypothetical protein